MHEVCGFAVEYKTIKLVKADIKAQQIQLATLLATATRDSEQLRWLVLVFRGTSDLQDWIINVAGVIDWDSFRDFNIGVHTGWQHVMSAQPGGAIQDPAVQFIKRVREFLSVDGIIITGHSLGGALAKITALRICVAERREPHLFNKGFWGFGDRKLKELLANAKCITFGAPNPFAVSSEPGFEPDTKVRGWLQTHVLNFVNANDLVPRLPNYSTFVEKLGFRRNFLGYFSFGVDVRKLQKSFPSFRNYVVLSCVCLLQHAKNPIYTLPEGAEELLGGGDDAPNAPTRPAHPDNQCRPSLALSLSMKMLFPRLLQAIQDHKITEYKRLIASLPTGEMSRSKL